MTPSSKGPKIFPLRRRTWKRAVLLRLPLVSLAASSRKPSISRPSTGSGSLSGVCGKGADKSASKSSSVGAEGSNSSGSTAGVPWDLAFSLGLGGAVGTGGVVEGGGKAGASQAKPPGCAGSKSCGKGKSVALAFPPSSSTSPKEGEAAVAGAPPGWAAQASAKSSLSAAGGAGWEAAARRVQLWNFGLVRKRGRGEEGGTQRRRRLWRGSGTRRDGGRRQGWRAGRPAAGGAPEVPGLGSGTVGRLGGAGAGGLGNATVLSAAALGAPGAGECVESGGSGAIAGRGMTPVVMERPSKLLSGACGCWGVSLGMGASWERPSEGKGITPVVIEMGGTAMAREPPGVCAGSGTAPSAGRRGAGG